MKQIDLNGLDLCKIQAKIFEESLNEFTGSSAVFIRRFMNSKVAQRMDNVSFLFESDNTKNLFVEIDEEFGNSSYGSEKYNKDELFWMGYIYRYWAYTYEITTKEIYKIIKAKELRSLYFPYHSLDPKVAIERILESKNIKKDENEIIRNGIKILRSIRLNK